MEWVSAIYLLGCGKQLSHPHNYICLQKEDNKEAAPAKTDEKKVDANTLALALAHELNSKVGSFSSVPVYRCHIVYYAYYIFTIRS